MNSKDFAVLAVEQHKQAIAFTPDQVRELLADLRGATFAKMTYVTKVTTSAAHKLIDIRKVTVASVQLFNNLNEFTNVYELAVKRSAAKIEGNDETKVAEFTSQGSYFEHTDCYSLVKHKTQDKHYLFAIFNSAESVYIRDGERLTKEQVAEFLTPSAKAELLKEKKEPIENKATEVQHNVIVRTIGLENIVELTALKQTLYV